MSSILHWVAIVAAAALLPACAPRDRPGHHHAGYHIELVHHAGAQVVIISAPDGRMAGAQSDADGSRLIPAGKALTMLAESAAAFRPASDAPRVSLSIPFAGVSIAAQNKGGAGEPGERARIEIAAGRQTVMVNVADTLEGERAHVEIAGADAKTVRDFIANAENFSEETKAGLREALAL